MAVVRTEVCGIPTFVAEAPGPVIAALIFRVGMCDEALPIRGISHLCEHLALSSLDQRDHPFNGFVTSNLTHFVVQGTADEVVQHFADVSAALRDLPVARFDKEIGILRAEAAGQPNVILDLLLKRRYGARGYGRVGFPEYGLRRLTADDAVTWAMQRFGASAATLWIAGPDAEGVAARCELELPTGEAVPLPSLDTIFRPPGRAELDVLGPCLAVVGRRSPSLIAALAILHLRLEREARHERALTYSIGATYEPLTDDLAHAQVGFDAEPAHHQEAVDALYSVLDAYGDGPTDDEVERHIRLTKASWADPHHGTLMAQHLAKELLLGSEDTLEDIEQRTLGISVQSIKDAFSQSMAAALLISPRGTKAPDNRLLLLSEWSLHEVEGREFRPVAKEPRGQRAIVSSAGVTYRVVPGKHITVRAEACEALAHWDDGTRAMVGSDGFSLMLAPWEWHEGDQLIDAVDAAVAPERWIPMGEGDGQPEDDTGRGRKLWRARKR